MLEKGLLRKPRLAKARVETGVERIALVAVKQAAKDIGAEASTRRMLAYGTGVRVSRSHSVGNSRA